MRTAIAHCILPEKMLMHNHIEEFKGNQYPSLILIPLGVSAVLSCTWGTSYGRLEDHPGDLGRPNLSCRIAAGEGLLPPNGEVGRWIRAGEGEGGGGGKARKW
jgi:hypothetical protein